MLIAPPLVAGDVASVKLVNGDEILGKFVSQDAHVCVLSKPVIVAIQPVNKSEVQLGFLPFMVSSNPEGNVSLPLTSMLTKAMKTRDDVARNYRRATSSLDVVTAEEAGRAGLIT